MQDELPLVSTDQVQNLCKMGQGSACCMYLTFTPGHGMTCERHGPLADTIFKRASSGQMVAESINCTGYPNFTPTTQEPCAHCGMVMEHINGKCIVCDYPQ